MRPRPAILVSALLALTLTAACTMSPPPDRPPDISGTIMSVDEGTLLIIAEQGTAGAGHDQASVTLSPTTRVFQRAADGKVGSVLEAEIVQGAEADVWFTGPVAESYPVQATAEAVLLW